MTSTGCWRPCRRARRPEALGASFRHVDTARLSRMSKVLHQGALDGLCAVYAVVHAARLSGLEARPACARACQAVPPKVWPRLLLEGAYFGVRKKMGVAAVKDPALETPLRVRAPFERNPPPNNLTYWARFDELFDDEA